MAEILRGAPVARALVADAARRAAALGARGVTPTLLVVRVGERGDDLAYERGIERRCGEAGVALRRCVLPAGCSEGELLDAIAAANADAGVHGCLLFRPLPARLDEGAACAALASAKDVDGVTPGSLFGVFAGVERGFAPCTAEAVMELLRFYQVPLDGARACVVGRSLVVGRPLAALLQARDATVTLCHSHTRDLALACRQADVVVVATGRPGTFGAAQAAPGQVVVDVGTTWDAGAGRLVGDVDEDAVSGVVRALTPVPGGVGAVTTAVLVRHVVEAAERGEAR